MSELFLGPEAIFSSKELSSSPEEPAPSMNIEPFLEGFSVVLIMLCFIGIASGARCVCER